MSMFLGRLVLLDEPRRVLGVLKSLSQLRFAKRDPLLGQLLVGHLHELHCVLLGGHRLESLGKG
jgi:hypothetical protein